MEAVTEGLWGLTDYHEKKGEIAKAVKCLEAICQSHISFLPIIEVKTRLRIATLLLKHSDNVTHAKSHLERCQVLLKSIPSCFELKCRTYSLLSQCYHIVEAFPAQMQILSKGLELTVSSGDRFAGKLWFCNFTSQLANALIIEGNYQGSISTLQDGYKWASEMLCPELQMFFATSMLHVHLMMCDDQSTTETAIKNCNELWDSIEEGKRQQCTGLFFYYQLLHIFFLLRICDFKNAGQHVETLDTAMKADMQRNRYIQDLKTELEKVNLSLSHTHLNHKEKSALSRKQGQLLQHLSSIAGSSSHGKTTLEPAYFGNIRRALEDKLELAPSPINGEWLPKSAVYAVVELMVIVLGRPKGNFKECVKRIQSGIQSIQDELVKLGITDNVGESVLQRSTMWMAGVYLMLLMQFLENKVAMELTRSEFVEAQEALVQMRDWFVHFPTTLQDFENIIEMLRGQYAHSVGCYSDAAFHFIEAGKMTENKSTQAMCHIYAAVSYICIGDPESAAQAFDLVGPVYNIVDSFVGVREKTSILLAYGFLLIRQQNLQEARVRLATGLQIAHNHLGNLQLVSQYLTILGHLALALHDTGQAREILRSSLTLAKKVCDIPTQIWVVSNLTALYQQLGEKGNEMENIEYHTKKMDDLQKRLNDACSSIHHIELIDRTKIKVNPNQEVDGKRFAVTPLRGSNLDIPESVGLSHLTSSAPSRLRDLDIGRGGKRKL
ncbi:sister chromatid cohesion protein SCC4 [Impatiens glandulifera]|uniref:sister chromatid cohesion protein SCC4 n=1 Tax=Impatiens glandulifera TaxID=253017 RepID=UPI001FB11676|nr:sister chromatid cohesion protein SCC4 [Impatiens glandulifera]